MRKGGVFECNVLHRRWRRKRGEWHSPKEGTPAGGTIDEKKGPTRSRAAKGGGTEPNEQDGQGGSQPTGVGGRKPPFWDLSIKASPTPGGAGRFTNNGEKTFLTRGKEVR